MRQAGREILEQLADIIAELARFCRWNERELHHSVNGSPLVVQERAREPLAGLEPRELTELFLAAEKAIAISDFRRDDDRRLAASVDPDALRKRYRDAEARRPLLINAQRAQDLQVALGSRNTAVTGYGAGNAGAPEKSAIEKYGPMIVGALGAV